MVTVGCEDQRGPTRTNAKMLYHFSYKDVYKIVFGYSRKSKERTNLVERLVNTLRIRINGLPSEKFDVSAFLEKWARRGFLAEEAHPSHLKTCMAYDMGTRYRLMIFHPDLLIALESDNWQIAALLAYKRHGITRKGMTRLFHNNYLASKFL